MHCGGTYYLGTSEIECVNLVRWSLRRLAPRLFFLFSSWISRKGAIYLNSQNYQRWAARGRLTPGKDLLKRDTNLTIGVGFRNWFDVGSCLKPALTLAKEFISLCRVKSQMLTNKGVRDLYGFAVGFLIHRNHRHNQFFCVRFTTRFFWCRCIWHCLWSLETC